MTPATTTRRPPRLAQFLLRLALDESAHDDVAGDLDEEFAAHGASRV